jgi:hypothetical protein
MPLCSLPSRGPWFPAEPERKKTALDGRERGDRYGVLVQRHVVEAARDGDDVDAVRDGRVHARQHVGRVPPLGFGPDDLVHGAVRVRGNAARRAAPVPEVDAHRTGLPPAVDDVCVPCPSVSRV